MRIEAWRVHDTGLVAAPGPFRRLPGAVRHHQGRGEPWPARVTLSVVDVSKAKVLGDSTGSLLEARFQIRTFVKTASSEGEASGT